MTNEEAAKAVRQMEQDDPAGLLRQIESEAANNPEIAGLVEAARRAHEEATARGVPVEHIIAEWMKPAEPWMPKG